MLSIVTMMFTYSRKPLNISAKKMITPDEMRYGDMILNVAIEPSLYLDLLPIIEEEIQRIHERDENERCSEQIFVMETK